MFAGMIARPCGHLVSDKLRRDLNWNPLGKPGKNPRLPCGDLRSSRVLFIDIVSNHVLPELGDFGASHVFANRNELHFRSDDSLSGVVHLGHGVPGGGTKRLAL